jgi:hypothetical protein
MTCGRCGDVSEGSEADPVKRIAELHKRRADIDTDITRVQQSDVPLLDDTALKDRFQQFDGRPRGHALLMTWTQAASRIRSHCLI